MPIITDATSLARRQQTSDNAQSKGLSPDSVVAIVLVSIAILVLVIAGALLYCLRNWLKAAHCRNDANSMSAPGQTLQNQTTTATIQSRNESADPALNMYNGARHEVAIGIGRRIPSEEQLGLSGEHKASAQRSKAINARIERMKMEIQYPQGGIGDTPTTPSGSTSRFALTLPKEPISSSRSPSAPQTPPKDSNDPFEKHRPKLPAIITDFTLPVRQALKSAPQTASALSNQQGHGTSSVYSRSINDGSVASFHPTQHQRGTSASTSIASKGRRPSAVALSTPVSAKERGPEAKCPPEPLIEGTVEPAARSSSLSADVNGSKTSLVPRREVPLPEAQIIQEATPPGKPWWTREDEAPPANPPRRAKQRVLSSISERSLSRHASTSTHHLHRTSQQTNRHLSLGARSIHQPPPPYTPEDLNASPIPPLPSKPPRVLEEGPSFYIANETHQQEDSYHLARDERVTLSRQQTLPHQLPDLDFGPQLADDRSVRHPSLQRPPPVQSRRRSNSVPNSVPVPFLDPLMVQSIPLPARRDLRPPQAPESRPPMPALPSSHSGGADRIHTRHQGVRSEDSFLDIR